MNADKTIVVGIDGAHFELISSWIESGELPNIAQAIREGVTADLRSVLPPVTSPNWKAYATGKNPGKLGIFWWENIDMNGERVYYPVDRRAENAEFWEIIGQNSSAGVVNVPTTYPSRNVEPFIVSGAPDAPKSGYTNPPELEAELEDKFKYEVTKNTHLKNRPEKAAAEIVDLIDLRFDVGKYLLKKYDPEFLQITTFYINSLHHYFWDDEKTLKGWKVIDNHLGSFLDESYNIVLMSDHGATKIDTVFHINSWLEQEGYLSSSMGISQLLASAGITTKRLIELAARLNIRPVAKRLAPRWLMDRIPTDEGDVRRESKSTNLNWANTTVFASGQGPVYIKTDKRNYEDLRSEIIKRLSELRDPSGRLVANQVYKGESVYSGPYIDEAPDIVIDQRNGVHIAGGLGRDQIFTNPGADGWVGENKREGIFVATGPDMSTGQIDDLSILDLAPTLLHLHDCKVPTGLDGTVNKSVYRDGSNLRETSIQYDHQYTNENGRYDLENRDSEVENRLEDLGYL